MEDQLSRAEKGTAAVRDGAGEGRSNLDPPGRPRGRSSRLHGHVVGAAHERRPSGMGPHDHHLGHEAQGMRLLDGVSGGPRLLSVDGRSRLARRFSAAKLHSVLPGPNFPSAPRESSRVRVKGTSASSFRVEQAQLDVESAQTLQALSLAASECVALHEKPPETSDSVRASGSWVTLPPPEPATASDACPAFRGT